LTSKKRQEEADNHDEHGEHGERMLYIVSMDHRGDEAQVCFEARFPALSSWFGAGLPG
jgi:hypothetical protein